jgi:NADPH:quinone reductase-like Zn-dependent oxidoreductase
MKAFYSTAFGGSETSFYGDLPDPSAGKDQLLVEVKAVSVNPADYKIRRGYLKFLTGSEFPKILGSDFAGIVKEIGNGVRDFERGELVYGMTPVISGKQGAMAELLAVNHKNARQIPESMSFEEAAALPGAALTALNGIRNCKITHGKQILINGATGGVGHFAIQIAKAKGAIVTAACSPANAELAQKLGADDTIGYSKDNLKKAAGKFDAILDAYGKMDYEDICRLLKRRGVYATTITKPYMFLSDFLVSVLFGKKLTSSNLRSTPDDYKEMESLFQNRKLLPVIENYFTLDKAEEAFKLAEFGKHRGKIIIKI